MFWPGSITVWGFSELAVEGLKVEDLESGCRLFGLRGFNLEAFRAYFGLRDGLFESRI